MSDTTNYRESTVSGSQWTRAVRVVVENPYGQTPSLMFLEEEISILGDKQIKQNVANLYSQFDPENEDHVTLYTLLNAEYVKVREARDAAIATTETAPE